MASLAVAGHRSRKPVLPLLLVWMGAVPTTLAAPGELDPTFGARGRVLVNVPNIGRPGMAVQPVLDAATAVVEQGDGMLLVGRAVYHQPSVEDFSVMRFGPDGRPDTAFDGDGRTSVELPGKDGATLAVAALENGRILVAGATKASVVGGDYESGAILRYLPDGAIDRSFGSDGLVESKYGGSRAYLRTVAAQPDGRFVVGGAVITVAGRRDMVIARYGPEGQLDASFGSGGVVVMDFGGAGLDDEVHSLAVLANGQIVVGGAAVMSSGQHLAAARLAANGVLDRSFGTDGRAALELQRGLTGIPWTAMRLQGDGKLLLASHVTQAAGGLGEARVARLTAVGAPDPGFGSSGVATLALGTATDDSVSALLVEPDGSLLLAGTRANLRGRDAFVARLDAAGVLDRAFGHQGITVVDLAFDGQGYGFSIADSQAFPPRMTRLRSGALVIAASDQLDWGEGGDYFVLAGLRMSGGSAGVLGMTREWTRLDEGAGELALTVRRTGGATGAVSVEYATSSATAQGGADFTGASGTLSWPDGDWGEKTIRISIADDGAGESTESFEVRLANPSGDADVSASRTTVVIDDNDASVAASPPPPAASPAPTAGLGGGGGGTLGLPWVMALALAWLAMHGRFGLRSTRVGAGGSLRRD